MQGDRKDIIEKALKEMGADFRVEANGDIRARGPKWFEVDGKRLMLSSDVTFTVGDGEIKGRTFGAGNEWFTKAVKANYARLVTEEEAAMNGWVLMDDSGPGGNGPRRLQYAPYAGSEDTVSLAYDAENGWMVGAITGGAMDACSPVIQHLEVSVGGQHGHSHDLKGQNYFHAH